MATLPTDLRNSLGKAVEEARQVAEEGARRALDALAVDRREAHHAATPEQRALRNRLRAHGRQLGDVRDARTGTQGVDRLVREVAYEHWHRMLFARFLAENDLLVEPVSGVAVTLAECEELARERSEDPWALAASFAQLMLPRIFRAEDPALALTLPPETRQRLQRLAADLPAAVFTAEDSLGWTYQYWQAAEKDAVNERAKSGEKITGETLPAVTQLFTEPYMVRFLLHNTIGAWHAGKVLDDIQREAAASERELRDAVRLTPLGGYNFDYLRFVREPSAGDESDEATGPWRPAAGTFERWPEAARDLKVLDPCCGSGHFVVAAFELLVRLRMQEEGLTPAAAVRAVITENLHALELDARCTQIAAFNLALAAWKLVGSAIDLPPMRIACSGVGPQASRDEWLELAARAAEAGGMPGERDLFGSEDTLLSAGVRGGLEALYDLFERAPDLGSLIDPVAGAQFDALKMDFASLEPLLGTILERERADDEELERAVAARGMAEAASILLGPPGGYTLVTTNVPYLARGSHTDWLRSWADTHYRNARNDLATIFLSRMLRWVGYGDRAGTFAGVTPQNWLFLTGYRKLRERVLQERSWALVARLGPGAFETISGHVVNVALVVLSGQRPLGDHMMAGIDGAGPSHPGEKAALLRGEALVGETLAGLESNHNHESPGADGGGDAAAHADPAGGGVRLLRQSEQLTNPDGRIALALGRVTKTLEEYCSSIEGLTTGDLERFAGRFWEGGFDNGWTPYIQNVTSTLLYGGRTDRLWWEEGDGVLNAFPRAHNFPARVMNGREILTKMGLRVTQMGAFPVTVYGGEVFGKNAATVVPHDPAHLPAIWAYCTSPEFPEAVRRIDQSLKVTNRTLVKVPFDLVRWQKIAEERYPDGLPKPYSDDPTQWIFHGHPARAAPGTELHVAVARLLGYRWPAELDSAMRLSDEARALVERSAELDAVGFADEDGVVPLSPVRGESSAAERLRSLLAAAYGSDWTAAKERELLAAAAAAGHGKGRPARSLDAWLRGAFFEEHCKLFHHRPFVWHVWDGLQDGFNALVSYHALAGPDGVGRRTLEAITFSYLGEWIDRQRADREAGREGSDARLAAALALQEELRRILEGEPPYDLFVRWKPLHEQPLGWDPDINDGVRLNIRPFLKAGDVGRKNAGILRYRPSVRWGRDRGKEPEELRPREQFPWFWSCNPEKQPEHQRDFGAGTPGSTSAGEDFDGVRWNQLHYTRAARERARSDSEAGASS